MWKQLHDSPKFSVFIQENGKQTDTLPQWRKPRPLPPNAESWRVDVRTFWGSGAYWHQRAAAFIELFFWWLLQLIHCVYTQTSFVEKVSLLFCSSKHTNAVQSDSLVMGVVAWSGAIWSVLLCRSVWKRDYIFGGRLFNSVSLLESLFGTFSVQKKTRNMENNMGHW